MKQLVYLKSNVRLEPLQWRWYSWSYLLAPITAAKLMVKNMGLLQSYLSAPQVHYDSANNPKLPGGSFVAIDPAQMHMVEDLLLRHKIDCAELIKLADDFNSFDAYLQNMAKGASLESLYAQIPSSLQGCIELVYDCNNNPDIRIIEAILYRKYSAVFQSGQSITLSQTTSDKRSLAFSTPRIHSDATQCLPISFKDTKIDFLSKLRYMSRSYDDVIEQLQLTGKQIDKFQSFLTEQTPSQMSRHNGEGIRVRYFGHACVLIETCHMTILIDPLINYRHDNSPDCLTLNDLPEKIDYVLITHGHQDHIVFETLLQIRHKVDQIVVPQNLKGSFIDPSMRLLLSQLGFSSIITLEEFEKIALPEGEIMAIPFLGEHADLNVQAKSAYAIVLNHKKFLFLADSNNLDNHIYEFIYEELGAIDYLFIGMECKGAPMYWFYNKILNQLPSKTDCQSRRFDGSDAEKAWRIITTLRCKSVYIYAMAMEPWLSHLLAINYDSDSLAFTESKKLLALCHEHNIKAQRPFLKMEEIL